MFGTKEFRNQVLENFRQLELQIADLKKSDAELKTQNARLFSMVRGVGKKLTLRLPLSLESLEKGLAYDLIFPDEVDAWLMAAPQGIILDVRAAHEHARESVPGSYSIPFDQLAVRHTSLEKDTPILLVCDNGIKSVAASELLAQKGFAYVYVLKGGMSLYRGPRVSQDVAEALGRSEMTSTFEPTTHAAEVSL